MSADSKPGCVDSTQDRKMNATQLPDPQPQQAAGIASKPVVATDRFSPDEFGGADRYRLAQPRNRLQS